MANGNGNGNGNGNMNARKLKLPKRISMLKYRINAFLLGKSNKVCLDIFPKTGTISMSNHSANPNIKIQEMQLGRELFAVCLTGLSQAGETVEFTIYTNEKPTITKEVIGGKY